MTAPTEEEVRAALDGITVAEARRRALRLAMWCGLIGVPLRHAKGTDR